MKKPTIKATQVKIIIDILRNDTSLGGGEIMKVFRIIKDRFYIK